MSSSVQSVDSASTEAIRVAHPLNNVNHNHQEPSSPKSLKRTRSPSLTRDDPPNEIHNETPTKKSRRKRNTTDIDQSLGTNLSAEKLHIIDGQRVNHTLIFMFYKNKFVITYH